jgi:hypothetical protein
MWIRIYTTILHVVSIANMLKYVALQPYKCYNVYTNVSIYMRTR